MHIEDLREYCLSMNGVEEDFPFDETTLVFKVGGKIFCLTDLEGDLSINLKNTPEKNIELREMHPEITPGYHMNKQHWNTVQVKGPLSDNLIRELIRDSYQLVFTSLSAKRKNEINTLNQ